MKLAAAIICKGSDDEAVVLRRCLKSISPYVDGIFLTVTHKAGEEPNAAVCKVGAEFKANVSYFEWINDFAAARNFNFSKVTKDYDYILWCDADDVWQNLDKFRDILEKSAAVDAFLFNYLYEFDSSNNPTVVHKKTQVVRNDGCVNWVGKLHEDFHENRKLNAWFVGDIQRIHLTTKERGAVAAKRNVEISKEELKLKKEDPRAYFNLANSYLGAGNNKLAIKNFKTFMEMSQSDDEKYLVYMRLSACENAEGNFDRAVECLQIAIGMFPEAPDAYNALGYLYFSKNFFDKAEKYLLIGLQMKPQYHRTIVYNPRDYDYNPMMALAKVYFNKARPDYALPMLKGCLAIYPDDKSLQEKITIMEKELERLQSVLDAVKHMETLNGDKDKILYNIKKLPIDLQSHPAICRIRNQYFVKTTSTGKDIAYYCGETSFDWNPDLFKTKGFGGSEEAVINLSKEWVKLGYNVTVFNSCGFEDMVRDGVTYKPFWSYNPKDKYDHLILWRSPRLADRELNATNIYVDMHDVISAGEFNEARLKKITKVFVKTQAHRILFPNVTGEQIAIIPNGIDVSMFEGTVKRDPYLLLNTSSPDRSMDVLPKLFLEVKKRVPQAKLAWCYGWTTFDLSFRNDKRMIEWRDKIQKECDEAGIMSLGKIPQAECAEWYQRATILAYPTEFYEIDCLSVKKAQLAGCYPVATDFAALNESISWGAKIHSTKTKDNWSKPYQISFGLEGKKEQKAWVDAVVEALKNPPKEGGIDIGETFKWSRVANAWAEIFK
jgi:tetratricopeptide (TPR) repeat protein